MRLNGRIGRGVRRMLLGTLMITLVLTIVVSLDRWMLFNFQSRFHDSYTTLRLASDTSKVHEIVSTFDQLECIAHPCAIQTRVTHMPYSILEED